MVPKGTFALLIARSFYLSPVLSTTDLLDQSSLSITRVRDRKVCSETAVAKRGAVPVLRTR